MAGLANLLEMGKQGMLYAQASIQTTGKNIANVNTVGYSRQRLDINPLLPEIFSGFSLGSAINGDTLRRIREDFNDRQFWGQNSLMAQYTSEETLLRQLEGILPASNDAGLRAMLDEFWVAWNNLANDPEGTTVRTGVRDTAEILTQTFNRIHREYRNLQSNIGSDITSVIVDINNLTKQIAELNRLNPGNNPDLEDQRDRLIDRLSTLANITVRKDGASVSINMGGLLLVAGRTSYNLNVDETLDSQGVGQIQIKLAGSDQQVNITSGEMGAMLKVFNEDIPNALNQIDLLALTIIEQVNAVHQTGFNLDGITGLNFFDDRAAGAASMRVDSAIVADPFFIASSDTPGEPGNSEIAKAISSLSDEALIGNQTIGENFRSLMSTVGNRIRGANFLRTSQEKVVDHLALQRQSVSGVSIEEEMTRLVKLEQAFAAASRLVATADELVRTLLQLI